MSTRWHIDETKRHVERLYGRAQVNLASPSLRSVVDRQEYARIHYHDTLDVLDAFVKAKLRNTTLLEIVFASDDETANEFQLFILRIGAYVTAFIQNLHAVPDILGHAIYYCPALDRSQKALPPRDITAKAVLRGLKSESELTRLSDLYDQLFSGGAFPHLSAMANHSKHRSVVLPSINEDQTGAKPERHTLQLAAFDYEGTPYPQVAIRDLLAPEFDRCSFLVVAIGNEMNDVLRRRAP